MGSAAYNGTDVKGNQSRAWTSFVKCINTLGRALSPLIIFKAATIQGQWFEKDFNQPGWHFARSKNEYATNAIALEWLRKVFLPQTQSNDPSAARLLIVNGHGSHSTDEFMWECFSNNVYLLFMPAHTSHVLQPLDLTCFFPLKAAYRKRIANLAEITDSAPIGKLQFLRCYAEARKEGLRPANIKAGFRASGLYPISRAKALANAHVLKAGEIVAEREAILQQKEDLGDPKGGTDMIELFQGLVDSAEARQAVRSTARAMDEKNVQIAALTRDIEKLNTKIQRLAPQKRRTILMNPNERLMSMDQVLADRVYLAQRWAYEQALREVANLADSDQDGEGYEEEEEENEAIVEDEVIGPSSDEGDEDILEHIGSSATRAGRAIRFPARYHD